MKNDLIWWWHGTWRWNTTNKRQIWDKIHTYIPSLIYRMRAQWRCHIKLFQWNQCDSVYEEKSTNQRELALLLWRAPKRRQFSEFSRYKSISLVACLPKMTSANASFCDFIFVFFDFSVSFSCFSFFLSDLAIGWCCNLNYVCWRMIELLQNRRKFIGNGEKKRMSITGGVQMNGK